MFINLLQKGKPKQTATTKINNYSGLTLFILSLLLYKKKDFFFLPQ